MILPREAVIAGEGVCMRFVFSCRDLGQAECLQRCEGTDGLSLTPEAGSKCVSKTLAARPCSPRRFGSRSVLWTLWV